VSTTDELRAYAIAVATSSGVDAGVFVAQIQQESGFNPNARSPAGAEGIAQFMPATAASVGIDPWDPHAALRAAAQLDAAYLARYHGDYPMMLAAYNAGPGAVDRYGGVPPYGETQTYIARIMPALGSIGGAPAVGAQPGALGALPGWAALSGVWASLSSVQRMAALGAAAAGAAWFVLGDL
jgi:soluble lytic murein transglycosylase-like protein